IESMAAGKARIGSNVDGTPQLIRDGIDGLLFKSGDIEELALKMDLLMGDKKLRKKMGEAGRRRARLEFSEENYIKNIRKFYDDTIIKCA
ncbi:MAG: glycosyltransferase family 4 protein, partial [Fibrobacter sp.]|nr:glycosyltransferase family 4 protein [Fibrobacter sp.]